VQYQNLVSEFIEYLRPLTIIGRLNLRNVPFKIKVPRQTAGASVGWVGEGQASQGLQALAFDSVTLDIAKIAGIVVLTDELARHSAPSAECWCATTSPRPSSSSGRQFVDPSKASTAPRRPRSPTASPRSARHRQRPDGVPHRHHRPDAALPGQQPRPRRRRLDHDPAAGLAIGMMLNASASCSTPTSGRTAARCRACR
jgi:hypothetical protein